MLTNTQLFSGITYGIIDWQMRVTEGFHGDRDLQPHSPDPTQQTTLNFPFIQLVAFSISTLISEVPAEVSNPSEKVLERIVITSVLDLFDLFDT